MRRCKLCERRKHALDLVVQDNQFLRDQRDMILDRVESMYGKDARDAITNMVPPRGAVIPLYLIGRI